MAYKFGPKSLQELQGVHVELVRTVHRALALSSIDFGVHDGLRTKVEQAEYVRTGVSKTMNSKHLPQADGFSHAVDLVPYVNGKLRWEWEPIYLVAEAMHKAATETGIQLVWGGVWDRKFPSDFTGRSAHMKLMVDAYVSRRRKLGKSAFIDGPHFEMVP